MAEPPQAEPAPREPARRLFFALWPDEPMRQAMTQATAEAVRRRPGSDPVCGGRPVPSDNLHVTLAFLGSVAERRLPELAAAALEAAEAAEAAEAPGSAFPGAGPRGNSLELAFDRLEYWRAARVLCAVPAEPPASVAALARGLQDALVRRGFAPDLKPFRPHVTVARKVARASAVAGMHPVRWRFTELALIESRTLPEGALYSVVGSYPLCGGKTANNSETP